MGSIWGTPSTSPVASVRPSELTPWILDRGVNCALGFCFISVDARSLGAHGSGACPLLARDSESPRRSAFPGPGDPP